VTRVVVAVLAVLVAGGFVVAAAWVAFVLALGRSAEDGVDESEWFEWAGDAPREARDA